MRARDWREAADRRRCWQRLGTEDSRQLCAGAGFLQVQSPVHIKDQQRQIKPSRVKWKVVHVKTRAASIQNHKKNLNRYVLIGLYAHFIINRHIKTNKRTRQDTLAQAMNSGTRFRAKRILKQWLSHRWGSHMRLIKMILQIQSMMVQKELRCISRQGKRTSTWFLSGKNHQRNDN